MKIVGLIAEYNPFHNGHLYHIRKAKEITGADAVSCYYEWKLCTAWNTRDHAKASARPGSSGKWCCRRL